MANDKTPVDKAIADAYERPLVELWDAYCSRRLWVKVLTEARAAGDPDKIRVAEDALADLPEISALDALRVSRTLVDSLTGRRWYVMQDAREAGCSWSEIGAALEMTKQGAQDWYRRKIDMQRKYVGAPLHDDARARAVLEDET